MNPADYDLESVEGAPVVNALYGMAERIRNRCTLASEVFFLLPTLYARAAYTDQGARIQGELHELLQLVASTQQAAEDVAASLQDAASRARQHSSPSAGASRFLCLSVLLQVLLLCMVVYGQCTACYLYCFSCIALVISRKGRAVL